MRHLAAIDLFCGVGGLMYGLRQVGIQVLVGVDIDPSCRYPVERNNKGTRFIQRSICELPGSEVASWYPSGSIRVLVGCAPCQPFSKYAVREGIDERWRLLYQFLRIVQEVKPDVVSMENVPQLAALEHPAYSDFVTALTQMDYAVWAQIVRCSAYGVPQTRERLVLLAGANNRPIHLIPPTRNKPPTVRDTIARLPKLEADGQSHHSDKLHVASRLSELNLKRIRSTPEGGGWKDWPESLRLACHKRKSGRYYGSVYGRMAWDELAPTITTQCFGYGNGRFGHPDQDRAISLREAAMLQTFPRKYKFTPPSVTPTFKNIGRLIGNAVPVALGRAIGKSIKLSF